jgi:hypothetical protein
MGCCNYNVHNTIVMNFNELSTIGLCQDGNRGHWMKTLKPQHDQEKKLQLIMKNSTKTCIFIINHEKTIHD